MKIEFDRLMRVIESDSYTGFCLSCGEEVEGVEPDARKYICPECKMPAVYGAEQILLMGGYEE